MSEIPNPHDLVFKEQFSRLEIAADFIANYLPQKVVSLLDLSVLERLPDSFVDPELKEHFSDLLYRVKPGGGGDAFVYVLMEHKSSPDKFTALQLLRYIVRIWEKYGLSKQKLPPVFPIVLYHGAARWTAAQSLSALIDLDGAETLGEYMPELRYCLCNLQDYESKDVRGHARLQIILLGMKYVFSGDLVEKLREIMEVGNSFHQEPTVR